MSNERPCRYCRAALGDCADDLCEMVHDQPVEVLAPLATEMARVFQHDPPSDEQVGWFMEDARDIVGDFDPIPGQWSVTELGERGGWVQTFNLNGLAYGVPDGDGHITACLISSIEQDDDEPTEAPEADRPTEAEQGED